MTTAFDYLELNILIKVLTDSNTSRDTLLEGILIGTRMKAGLSSAYRQLRVTVPDNKLAAEHATKWLQERGYIIIPTHYSRIAIRDDPTRSCINTVVDVQSRDNVMTVSASGDEAEVSCIIQWVEATFITTGSLIITVHGWDPKGGMRRTDEFVMATSINTTRDTFYPWLNVPLRDYFKAYMASEASILILHGTYGTGKSSFLRSLILSENYRAVLAYDDEAVSSERLLSYFIGSRATILAYEDVDRHLSDRESGNPLMASLLNVAQGVVQHPNKKIILSTNLPEINKIDPALLRKGRCFDILKFRLLTSKEAYAVLADLGREPTVDLTTKDYWTLAEVLSSPTAFVRDIDRVASGIGIGR